MTILLRSLAFNALFYLNTLLYLIIALPTFFMPYHAIIAVAKSWARTNLVLLRAVAGIDYEFRGLEKLPPGPIIIASKHQSAWETFALLPLVENPVFILKRELQWIPVFGWLTIKGRMVPVDRGGGSQALAAMIERARVSSPTTASSSFFRKGHAAPQAPSHATSWELRIFTRRKGCPAFRSRSIQVCSGRAARFAASREPLSPKSSTRLHQGSTRMPSSRVCRMILKPRPRG